MPDLTIDGFVDDVARRSNIDQTSWSDAPVGLLELNRGKHIADGYSAIA